MWFIRRFKKEEHFKSPSKTVLSENKEKENIWEIIQEQSHLHVKVNCREFLFQVPALS